MFREAREAADVREHHCDVGGPAAERRFDVAARELLYEVERRVLAQGAHGRLGALEAVEHDLDVAERSVGGASLEVEGAHARRGVADAAKPPSHGPRGEHAPAEGRPRDDEIEQEEPVAHGKEPRRVVLLGDDDSHNPVLRLGESSKGRQVALAVDVELGRGLLSRGDAGEHRQL